MNKMFEIGELGIVRDIPAEITQLESANNALRSELQNQKTISGILFACLVGAVIYIVLKTSSNNKVEE